MRKRSIKGRFLIYESRKNLIAISIAIEIEIDRNGTLILIFECYLYKYLLLAIIR